MEASLSKTTAELTQLKEKVRIEQGQNAAEVAELKSSILAAESKIKSFKMAAVSSADAAVLDFIELLQRKGRFMDFVMGDISSVEDVQVGAASRVVHQGLSELIKDFMKVEPVISGVEGELVSVEATNEDYTLVGSDNLNYQDRGPLFTRAGKIPSINLPKKVN